MRTYTPKASEIQREWFVVDAAGQTLGRLAVDIAKVLMGKHKPTFVPHLDTGDFVIVVNASQIKVTGRKLTDKLYYRHSGYPGGLRATSFQDMLTKHPTFAIEAAVRGMLPRNRLGRAMIKKLKVYAGSTHPHEAQQPKAFEEAK
ncbi:MAG: 50S ribosomal protein L13 [Chloroflexi bacterium]|nr:50S ribosomal protein L13 [Chloroflexota bacterium]